jgi:uroporphyrinogen-III synthase
MRILITRPEDDAAALATELGSRGHEVTTEPLLKVIFPNLPAPDLTGVQALLFTSANGVRAFVRLDPRRDTSVFAVGTATAGEARSAGFHNVVTAAGDVVQLGAAVAKALDPAAGGLIHIAGSVQAGDLKGDLAAKGFNITRAVLYETREAQTLSPATIAKIKGHEIDIILFFSPRTAQTFTRLVAKHQLGGYLNTTTAAALSISVRDVLHSLPWHRIVVANRPALEDLLTAAGLKTST